MLYSVLLLSLYTLLPVLACWSPFHVHHQTCPGPPEVYVIRPSQGKGLGVFAMHDLDVGDIIIQETSILKITPPGMVKGAGYPMSAVSKLVRDEFEALSPKEKDEVMSLTYLGTAADEVEDKLGIIFKNNAYNSGSQVGLFLKIARINHSCRPNTSYYWSDRLNKRIVYAARKILPGEELFVSYIPLLLTQTERQNHLNRYGFRCTCEACAQERSIIEASDNRRTTLKKAFVDFESQLSLTPAKTKRGRQQARQNAKTSVYLTELVHKESLADYYAKAYRIAAISHARVKDWQPAAMWANKGYELKYMEDPQSPYTLELYGLTKNFISSWESELRSGSGRSGVEPITRAD
jgi:hypothetical protein